MAKSKSAAPKKLTKSALLQAVVDKVGEGASRKEVKAIIDALKAIAQHTKLVVEPAGAASSSEGCASSVRR